jgi:hypothetical protein
VTTEHERTGIIRRVCDLEARRLRVTIAVDAMEKTRETLDHHDVGVLGTLQGMAFALQVETDALNGSPWTHWRTWN